MYGEPDTTTPDPGHFGPGSLTWRVHGDVSGGVGGVRSLLLQALHPQAMAALERHSDFRTDSWGRLFRTAEYIAVTSFGTTAEADAAAARVRRVHRALNLDNPEHLLWIHCGFVESLLSTYRRSQPALVGASLSDAEADAYVAEQVTAATFVGLPAADVPSTVAELDSYLSGMRPRLAATAATRDAARFVLVPPMDARYRWLTPAQGMWAVIAGTAFASLPAWSRRMYGGRLAARLPGWTAIQDAQTAVALPALRRTLLALPESVRTGPHLRAARARLGIS